MTICKDNGSFAVAVFSFIYLKKMKMAVICFLDKLTVNIF